MLLVTPGKLAIHHIWNCAYASPAARVGQNPTLCFVRLSLVAEIEKKIVGHILFSRLPIITGAEVQEALALAPMAVLPTQQRRGIGTRLVEEGLRLCREAGHKVVIVLGHPAFYPRSGGDNHLRGHEETRAGDDTLFDGRLDADIRIARRLEAERRKFKTGQRAHRLWR